MSKFLEIELKFDATGITPKEFLKSVKKEFNNRIKHLKGTDYYFKNGSNILRYRKTDENQELTVKRRHSKKNLRVRTEVNLQLTRTPDQKKEVFALLKETGYKKAFVLFKEYYIATFPLPLDKYGVGEIVWYKVTCKGKKPKYFIEIEVRGSSDNKKNLSYLEGRLKNALKPLASRQALNKSLYEIYK